MLKKREKSNILGIHYLDNYLSKLIYKTVDLPCCWRRVIQLPPCIPATIRPPQLQRLELEIHLPTQEHCELLHFVL